MGRNLSISWEDPVEGAARAAGMSGLEAMVNFTRPITRETGRVRCEGEVLHRGGRVATAEGRVIAERTGKLLAHGTTTCLILSAAGAPPSGNGRG